MPYGHFEKCSETSHRASTKGLSTMKISFRIAKQCYSDFAAFSVAGYVFFSVVPYATAGRYICSLLMLIALISNLVRGRCRSPGITWANLSLLGLSILALVSAIFGKDPGESLSLVKKDVLPFLLAYLLVVTAFDSEQCARLIKINVAALLIAFAFRTVMAAWVDVETGFRFSFYKESPELPRYLDFYAADSLYYTPILFAVILFADIGRTARYILWAIFGLMLFEVAVSGVRTTFALVSFSTFILLMVRFWRFRKYVAIGLIASVVVVFAAKDYVTNPTLARYYTLLDPKTYKFGQDFSVSERAAIASAVKQIVEKRPLLGYGPGWKKLPTVAQELGLLVQWQQSGEPLDQMKYNYFSLGEGRVNPHNFYLSVIFEVGILGLLAYLSFLIALLFDAVRKCCCVSCSATEKLLAWACICYVLVYLMAGFAGGPWLPATLLVFASSLALMKRPVQIRKEAHA